MRLIYYYSIFRSLFNEMDEKWKSIDDLAENDPNILQSYRRVSLLFAWKSRSHPSKTTLCQNHQICSQARPAILKNLPYYLKKVKLLSSLEI